jgi:phosphoribosylglycinamide formyltransferase-1
LPLPMSEDVGGAGLEQDEMKIYLIPHPTVYNFILICTWIVMTVADRRRFVVLISGQGSNMQAIVNYCLKPESGADVVAVVSSRDDVPGLAWASKAGIPTLALSHHDFPSREAFDLALADAIDGYLPDFVLLAGFMRILTEDFVRHYEGRLINIHPSLLPAFPGLHTHKQALAQGVQVHGCTVHFVTPLLDQGPIVAQGVVPVLSTDTVDSLAARVLRLEHLVYAKVCEWLAKGWVTLTQERRVSVEQVESRIFFLDN